MPSFTKVAVLLIASLLIFLRTGINADSIDDYRTQAEQGDAQSQYILGLCYANGDQVPKDMVESAKWFREAAENGLSLAQDRLGFCYHEGVGVPKDKVESLKWYRKAAESYREAQFTLGLYYSIGEEVPKDMVESAKWFRLAANQGHDAAQYFLGEAYARGDGVPKDDLEALKWFRLAAGNGNEYAQEIIEQLSENAASSDTKSTSEIEYVLKGKTKAEVKAYFGRPPDKATNFSWDYNGTYVDKDAEKVFSNCIVAFADDKVRVITFFASPY